MIQQLASEDIHRLIRNASETSSTGTMSRQLIIAGIYTGMRLPELQALTWDDIDLNKGTININKSWDDISHVTKPFKNESFVRTITINDQFVDLLKKLKKESQSNMVFMNHNQCIPSSTMVNKVLSEFLSDLKINPDGFLKRCHEAL